MTSTMAMRIAMGGTLPLPLATRALDNDDGSDSDGGHPTIDYGNDGKWVILLISPEPRAPQTRLQ